MCDPCLFPTMPPNKALQMDPHASVCRPRNNDVAKRTLFGVMQCVYVVRGSQNILFSHTVHYCFSSMPCLSETRWFLQSSSFWKARRALIGLLSGVLWLAEYLKHEMEMLHPSPYSDAVFQVCLHHDVGQVLVIIGSCRICTLITNKQPIC